MMRFVLIALLACCCATTAAIADGTLRRGNYYEPASIDPHKLNTQYEMAIALDMFEGLTAFTPDGEPEPAVAESWTTSADGREWTFKLRPGLRWSDGTPITADDVVFSFRRLMDPKTASPLAAIGYVIANAHAVNTGKVPVEKLGVTAVDTHTVVVSLENPAPYLPALLLSGNMAIVPRATVIKFGDDWIKPEHVVSNGAFVLKEWVPNGHVTLERNPLFRAPATLDTVIYEPTQDINAAVTRFRAGGLDMQFTFPSIQLAQLQQEIPEETKAVPQPLIYYVPVNIHNPKLADVRVRRALSLAVDRETLANLVMRGGQVASTTYVPPGFRGHQPPELPWHGGTMAERLERAKALMAAAGVTPAKPLRLVYTFGNTSDRKRVAVALAAMWKPLGVVLVLDGTESKIMFARLREADFELGFAGYDADYPDPITFLSVLLSSAISGNYSRYKSPVYDGLVGRAAQEPDPAVRREIMRQAERVMLEDQPIIPLFVEPQRELVSKRVRGWQPNSDAMHLSRYLSVE